MDKLSRRAGFVRVASAVSTLLVYACGEPIPGVSETAGPSTWLVSCESDDDCPHPEGCVVGLCSLACDLDSLASCAGLHADAVCDTELGMCDVPCGTSMACYVLGPGFVCEEGRCRELLD